MALSRRVFLVTTVSSVAARPLHAFRQGGLDAFAADSVPCVLDVKATPPVSRDASYRAGAPMRTSILEPGAGPGPQGIPLEITGIVAGLSCGPIANALLEFWQPDASGVFAPAGFSLRSRQRSDSNGRYRLSTIMPGASGNRAPFIGVHVVVERVERVARKAELWTAMFFPDQNTNARDARFREDLLVKLGGTDQKRVATFDVRLDL
jgi:protocatechuate 3,4-dioxygenase beta subunit